VAGVGSAQVNFSFHGWAVLEADFREPSFGQEEANEAVLGAAITALKQYLDEKYTFPFSFYNSNGLEILSTSGCSNHFRLPPLELFRLVAKIAPGSHGLLYILDHEDRDGWDNCYQAWVLKKGAVKRTLDPFLSPYITEVWEPEDEVYL
jgi:hypothetical protein